MKLQDLIAHLRSVAPLDLAAEWDNVGLLLGDESAEVQRVLTCLTVTPEVVAEAVQHRADLLLTHHPILFRPAKQITAGTNEGRMLLALARAGVAVYSAHTAFDNCPGGINDLIAGRLQLTEIVPLRRDALRQCKIVIFT